MNNNRYDIIGDIHGHAGELKLLLESLGYLLVNNVYRHPSKIVIYLGDFIDRGSFQKETIDIVRPMVEQGSALSVMGNHEYNAILYHTFDNNDYLRPHTTTNFNKHKAFTDAYADNHEEMLSVIAWFKTLPLWLDLGELRVVHACWDADLIDSVHKKYTSNILSDSFFIASVDKSTLEYQAIETLIKGMEVGIPPEFAFTDPDGVIRTSVRIKWWLKGNYSLVDIMLGGPTIKQSMPVINIVSHGYCKTDPPLFIGHYWFNGQPSIIADNLACLDYSVASSNGKLVCYSFSNEGQLSNNNFSFINNKVF